VFVTIILCHYFVSLLCVITLYPLLCVITLCQSCVIQVIEEDDLAVVPLRRRRQVDSEAAGVAPTGEVSSSNIVNLVRICYVTVSCCIVWALYLLTVIL